MQDEKLARERSEKNMLAQHAKDLKELEKKQDDERKKQDDERKKQEDAKYWTDVGWSALNGAFHLAGLYHRFN